MTATEDLLKSAWSSNDVPFESMECVVNHFGDDLDGPRLEAQLQVLENLKETSGKPGSKLSVDKIISTISRSGMQKMIPQVVKLCKLYLVHPTTTATAECSFSTLRRVKTYLRSTMSQARLNSLLLLNVYREQVESMKITDLANEFISRGDSKSKNAFAIIK